MENDTYVTRDIYLASVLVTLNFELLGIDYQVEGDKERLIGYFSFKKTQELLKAEKDYWNEKLVVEPRSFVLNMRGLKAQTTTAFKNPRTNLDDYNKN